MGKISSFKDVSSILHTENNALEIQFLNLELDRKKFRIFPILDNKVQCFPVFMMESKITLLNLVPSMGNRREGVKTILGVRVNFCSLNYEGNISKLR